MLLVIGMVSLMLPNKSEHHENAYTYDKYAGDGEQPECAGLDAFCSSCMNSIDGSNETWNYDGYNLKVTSHVVVSAPRELVIAPLHGSAAMVSYHGPPDNTHFGHGCTRSYVWLTTLRRCQYASLGRTSSYTVSV